MITYMKHSGIDAIYILNYYKMKKYKNKIKPLKLSIKGKFEKELLDNANQPYPKIQEAIRIGWYE